MTQEKIMGSEIPLPQDKLLLLDLDKTLIDAKYQITDERIYQEIQRVQSLGWQLGLSSDTPLKPMEKWKRELGMNGPIIAERGALIKLSVGTEIELVPHSSKYFIDLRSCLISGVAKQGIPFYHGDATAFLRSGAKLTGVVDEKLVLINAYRKCSLSFFGRAVNKEGELAIDNGLVELVISSLEREIDQAPFELEQDFNPDYGIFIISPKSVNKRLATQRLMSELQMTKIGMVGDSSTDIVGSDIAMHYAVGNAKDELKAISDYVAQGMYTVGVIEILLGIKS